jgi:hypothetical protein
MLIAHRLSVNRDAGKAAGVTEAFPSFAADAIGRGVPP